MKIIYNACYGGYGFSLTFLNEYKRRFPTEKDLTEYDESLRTDPNAIALLEELGSKVSSGHYADLQIEEIPDGVEFRIREYDGMEGVHWEIPKDEIIDDLVKLCRLEKFKHQCNPLTQVLLDKNFTTWQLRDYVREEFNKNK